MRCSTCQHENRAGALFCGKCGVGLSTICTECQSENPRDNNFCDRCGHRLAEPAGPRPVDYSKPQSYTPKYLAEKILITRSSIEGERKLVTVFFADVADYTAMSEKLDPEEIHQIMDGCFGILMDDIHRYEGTINQFIGDGVMALFGAPVAHEDHALRACNAALSAQQSLEEYGQEIKRNNGIDFKMRIGINSGPVLVGSIGDDLRMDYTAVGDTTNLAARMEGAAVPGTILVSNNTYHLAKRYFEFKSIGRIDIKGKKDLQDAYQLIRTGEVKSRIEASMARGLTRFIGRKHAMAELAEAYEKAVTGSGQVVGIVGEAGVGKSRALLEFIHRLPRGDFTYLDGRCLQYGGTTAYLPILDILRSYFEIKKGDRDRIIKQKIEEKCLSLDAECKSIIPPMQELLSLRVDNQNFEKLEPQQKREKTFEAIRDTFARLSLEKPLIIAIEDLHWIDKTSEEFLDYLIGWLVNMPVLLVLLYRTEYSHQWGSKSYYNRIGLNQLSVNSSGELVKAILEGGEVTQELSEFILKRSGGNPLFLEEFTYTLLEKGAIEKRDKSYALSRESSVIQVPDSIQGIIAARLDRLEDHLKRIMQLAAVIGRVFPFRILEMISENRKEIKSHLLDLQSLEFIHEKSIFPELEYIFKHALTQEVAYNSLLLKRRRELHERVGQSIEALYPHMLKEFYETLAHHFSKSENMAKASGFLKLAGDKATSNYSYQEALHFYEQAIQMLNRLPETEENRRKQIGLRLSMASPMRPLGYPAGSLDLLREGEGLSKALGDEKSLVEFSSLIGRYHIAKGDTLLGIKYGENSFRAAEKIQDVELMAPTAHYLCNAYNGAGQYFKSIEIAPGVIDLLEKTGSEKAFFGRTNNPYSFLCATYGYSMGQLGRFQEGRAFCEKGLRNAIEIGDIRTLGYVEWYYGLMFAVKGDWLAAIEHFHNCITHYEKVKRPIPLSRVFGGMGNAYSFIGDLEHAQKYYYESLNIHKVVGVEIHANMHLNLSWFCFNTGDMKNAQISSEKALEISQKNDAKHVEGSAVIILGMILSRADISRAEKAEQYIREGIELLEGLGMRPTFSQGYLFLGELYADRGDKMKASETLKNAEAHFDEMGMEYWLNRTRETLARSY